MENGYSIDGMSAKADEINEALRASGVIKLHNKRRNSVTTVD
jgi:hypothetical protein